MYFLNMLLHYYTPVYGSGTSSSGSLSSILSAATEMVTWLISVMGKYLGFVTDNPVILIMFLILLAGTGIAFLLRIWHSA
ncbi:MAG: hypothetical protein [Inoviridae sp.]|nr:MAG: hypothetical protein [Inoviridae sp.]